MRLVVAATAALAMLSVAAAIGQELSNKPAVSQGAWLEAWPGWYVVPWTFQTPPLNDGTARAYREQGIGAIHVDRRLTPETAAWLQKHNFRVYIDHAANKGYLYLDRPHQAAIAARSLSPQFDAGNGLVIRPYCLQERRTRQAMEAHVRVNVAAAKVHDVTGYSLDDEISTGSFVEPISTCWCPVCQPIFRKFVLDAYGSLVELNRAWGTAFPAEDQIAPATPEDALQQAATQPVDRWNFSRWADFREYMDQTMMDTLVWLVRLSNELDPKRPAGFEGAQAPSAWGGYDYSRISRAVQFIENYDIGGNDEILRTLAPKVVRMKTFGGTANPAMGKWRLWHEYCHGDRGVIIWPELNKTPWWNDKAELRPELAYLPAVFKELQGRVSGLLAGASPLDDGVAIYYSQPSIRAGWVMDAAVHGKTWPRRSGGVNDRSSSTAHSRKAWIAMIEDAGLQHCFVDAPRLQAGELTHPRFKVLVLPAIYALSDKEARRIREFAEAGGLVIADVLPGILDEHCRNRAGKAALDEMFGVEHDWAKGLYDGTHTTCIDGEKYRRPLSEMIPEQKEQAWGWPIAELGLRVAGTRPGKPAVYVDRPCGKGRAVLMNVSPAKYPLCRYDKEPNENVKRIRELLSRARPVVRVETAGLLNEVLRWRKGGRDIICVVKNGGDWSRIDPLGQVTETSPDKSVSLVNRPVRLKVRIEGPAMAGDIINERTGRAVKPHAAGDAVEFEDEWVPCEAAIYSCEARP